MIKIDASNTLICYAGFYKDNNKLLESSSGGAATVLSEIIIYNGGIVFGAKYSDDFKSAEYFMAESIDDLFLLKGSKYISVNKRIKINNEVVPVYKAVLEKLIERKKVLFIGLGCDVGGLIKYLNSKIEDMSNLYTIDLICQGPTLPISQKSFIEQLETKYSSKIKSFSVKNKKKGWTTPYIFAEFENGKKYYKAFYDSDLGYAFSKLANPKCYNCHYKGINHISDITIGDYWGLSNKDKYYNPLGVSAFIIHSNKGLDLIKQIDESTFNIKETRFENIIDNNPMYSKCRIYYKNSRNLLTNIYKYGIKKAVYIDRGLIKTIIIPFKRFISLSLNDSQRNKFKKIVKNIGGIKNVQ